MAAFAYSSSRHRESYEEEDTRMSYEEEDTYLLQQQA
jgi:hypothetical protein